MSLKEIIESLETKKFTITKTRIENKHSLDLQKLELMLLAGIEASVECESVVSQNTFYRFEMKMYCLPKRLLYMYLYYQLLYGFYDSPFENITSSISLLRSLQPKTIYLPVTIFKDLAIIHKYIVIDTFYLSIPPIYLPWSDIIIPKLFSSYNYIVEEQIKPVISTDLHMNYDNLIDIVTRILNPDETTLENISQWDTNQFLYSTDSIAVGVNGTACAGKTAILNKALEKIKTDFDPNAEILKAGKFGGYGGKDIEQVLSLSYQATLFCSMYNQYTSIADRDMFNNLIWRLILCHMDTATCTPKLIVDNFLSKISSNIIKIMTRKPIIILLDLNVPENRYRMYRRNTGGDRKRCFIEFYTPAQNAIYGLFAYLCNWPIFNRDFDQTKQDFIVDLIVSKINENIKNNNDKLPIKNTLEEGSFIYNTGNENITDYKTAVTLGIFK